MEENSKIYPWLVLILLFFNILLAFISLYCLPPLFREIMQEIPLTKTQMGIIMGVATIAPIIITPLGGALSDKVGCRWVLGLAAVISSIAGGLRYFSNGALALTIFMFFLGTGAGLFIVLMPKILGTWFPPKRLATVNGICFASVTIGSAIAMGASVRIMSPAFNGWRGTTMALGILSLIAGILWMVFYKDPKTEEEDRVGRPTMAGNFKTVLKVRDVWLFAIFYGLVMSALMANMALLPISLQEKGMSNAGELISIMLVTSLFSKIAGGMVSDKVGKRKIFIVVGTIILSLCTPSFIVFTGSTLVILLFFAGLFSGPVAPAMLTAAVEIKEVGTALAGTAMGFIIMVGTIGGTIGPLVAGMLMDAAGAAWPGFVYMGLSGLLAVIIFLPTKSK